VLDEVSILCEPAHDGVIVDELRARLQSALHEETGLTIRVDLVARGVVPRSEGQAVRVVDRRGLAVPVAAGPLLR
jgi:phenylacetate-coenzyme A ligase PaaK-like adenylate-forming protein